MVAMQTCKYPLMIFIVLAYLRCGHCQGLVPEYKKAASALKGIVRLGAVNADEHKSLGGQYGVKGFPTLKIFGSNKRSPTEYKGERIGVDC